MPHKERNDLTNMADVETKLQEAKFFLELLDALEQRGNSLTSVASAKEEASFLLSAILNSFYSVTEHAKAIVGAERVKQFKSKFPLFYAGKEGLRNITVHQKHIGTDHEGYIPPAGDRVRIDFRSEPKLIKQNKIPGRLVFVPYYYVIINNELVRIIELCYDHYYQLQKFVKDMTKVLSS